jgi:ABC-type amino acid transport substrate-binding protein
MRFLQTLVVSAIVSAAVAFMMIKFVAPESTPAAHKETSFERVMRTGTLRCGYGTWYPEFVKDPNTGQFSGYDYDVTNAIGKILSLKIEWVEEAGWGVIEQGVITGRYDMVCNGVWGPPARVKAVNFSMPFVHHPVYAIVANQVEGPTDSLEWLDDPKYAMAIIAGSSGDLIGTMHFPKARKVNALTLSTDGDVMMDIAAHKADFTFANYTTVMRFLESHPGSLKMLDKPMEVVGGTFLLPNDDPRMKNMIDKALEYLIDSGEDDKIMERAMGNDPRAWVPTRKSYDEVKP